MTLHTIIRSSVGTDYANEQIAPGIRMVPSTVMLSAAKHLAADRDRPFAEFTLSGCEGLRVTPAGSSKRVNAVMLSAAKHLDVHRERPYASLKVTLYRPSYALL